MACSRGRVARNRARASRPDEETASRPRGLYVFGRPCKRGQGHFASHASERTPARYPTLQTASCFCSSPPTPRAARRSPAWSIFRHGRAWTAKFLMRSLHPVDFRAGASGTDEREAGRTAKRSRAGPDVQSQAWRARRATRLCPPTICAVRSVLVPDGDAGNVGTLQRPAHRLGLVAVEAGEAGPEQLPVALATTGSLKGSALPSRPRAWSRARSIRARASPSLSSAPT